MARIGGKGMKIEFLIIFILCIVPIFIGITGLLGFIYSGMVEDFIIKVIKRVLIEAYIENKRR